MGHVAVTLLTLRIEAIRRLVGAATHIADGRAENQLRMRSDGLARPARRG
ncbi:MAG: hypothetical protein H6638_04620 [Ardenticatenales bacterium]|nr:hypothetical protein [Ardenticatenales bacterium]